MVRPLNRLDAKLTVISDTMIKYFLPTATLCLLASQSLALDASILSQLNRLEPQERLEQRCDIEAMEQVSKAKGGFNADRVVSYTFGAPKVTDNSIKASGAVFRSKGQWFRLKYKCSIDTKSLAVKTFDFEVGDEVPEEDWDRYYLYD